MGIKVGLIAEYSKIFPDRNETVEELSYGIPKTLIFQAGTTFLANQTLDNKSSSLLEVTDNWFRTANRSFKEEIINRINKYYSEKEISTLNILSPLTSLRLIQLGAKFSDHEEQKSEMQIEIDLYKIYLLLNEAYVQLHNASSDYIALKYPNIQLGLLLLNMSFSSSDLTNYIHSREFYCQSVKAMFLFDFLQKTPELKEHLGIFKRKYNITSLEEYYSRIFGFIQPTAQKEKEGFIEFTVEKENDLEFVSKISIQEYSDKDDVDFKLVRQYPLVQTGKNTYRITHPLFFTDKLYKSLYFEFSKINENLNNGLIKNFREFYTSNFSEKLLLYEIMKYCLKSRYLQFTGSEIAQLGIKGAPDYYIRNGKYIFLIENKDCLIKAVVKENPVFENIETELRKKFYEKENGKGVGIKQIVGNIEKVLTIQNSYDKHYNPQKVIIYPILIVHDIVYDCPGLNHLFNNWFLAELELLKEKGLEIKNVRPLIVLNIDTLIRTAEVLRLGGITLKELIELYYKNIVLQKGNYKSQEEMESKLTKVYLSSTKVIEDWLEKNKKLMGNRILDYAFNKMKL